MSRTTDRRPSRSRRSRVSASWSAPSPSRRPVRRTVAVGPSWVVAMFMADHTCHPERSEGDHAGLWLLRFAQDDICSSKRFSRLVQVRSVPWGGAIHPAEELAIVLHLLRAPAHQ